MGRHAAPILILTILLASCGAPPKPTLPTAYIVRAGAAPYRTSPILDPRALIFATAKAWHDGNQHWWGCYQ